jgi:hypothetical protein
MHSPSGKLGIDRGLCFFQVGLKLLVDLKTSWANTSSLPTSPTTAQLRPIRYWEYLLLKAGTTTRQPRDEASSTEEGPDEEETRPRRAQANTFGEQITHPYAPPCNAAASWPIKYPTFATAFPQLESSSHIGESWSASAPGRSVTHGAPKRATPKSADHTTSMPPTT